MNDNSENNQVFVPCDEEQLIKPTPPTAQIEDFVGGNSANATQNAVAVKQGVNNSFSKYLSTEQLEKRSFKLLCNKIGGVLCLFFAGSLVLAFVLGMIIGIFMWRERNFTFLGSSSFSLVFNAVITLILFTVPYLIITKTTYNRENKPMTLSQFLPFHKVGGEKFLFVIMFGLGGCMMAQFASSFLGQILNSLFGIKMADGSSAMSSSFDDMLLNYFAIAVLPALLEEFAFRGIIMSALRTKTGDTTAVFLSALLFGLLHGNLTQIPFAFAVGLFLGYSVIYTKSLWPAIIIHFINNALSVTIATFFVDGAPISSVVICLLIYAVFFVFGICGFICLSKTDKNAFKMTSLGFKKHLWQFLTSGLIILFIVFAVISAVVSQMAL